MGTTDLQHHCQGKSPGAVLVFETTQHESLKDESATRDCLDIHYVWHFGEVGGRAQFKR